jgi:hypothetical protein
MISGVSWSSMKAMLALLQPLHLNLVAAGGVVQRLDRGVKVAVLLLQPSQFRTQYALVFARHPILFRKPQRLNGLPRSMLVRPPRCCAALREPVQAAPEKVTKSGDLPRCNKSCCRLATFCMSDCSG